MNLATILLVIVILYVFTSNIATKGQMNRCLDKLERLEHKQQQIVSKFEEECKESEESEIQRIKEELRHLESAWRYATKEEIYEALPVVIPKIIEGEEWSI